MEKSLQTQAEARLRKILQKTQRIPALKKLCPGPEWKADVSLVGPTVMKRLNAFYRQQDYATDVLSFEAPLKFRAHGYLGELVICSSVVKKQAREHKHKPDLKLEILLVHGVLHLLGFDHEKGVKAAAEMRRWETQLLGRRAARGLISRTK